MSPINLSPQKHLGQLICHLDNSRVVPTVKSGTHFLRHGRCAIRKVLSPFLPSRQILWQGPLLLLEVDSAGSGIWHSFPSEKEASLDNTGAFDKPFISFPSNKCLRHISLWNTRSTFWKNLPNDSKNICIQRCWWSGLGLQSEVGPTLVWKASNALCSSHRWKKNRLRKYSQPLILSWELFRSYPSLLVWKSYFLVFLWLHDNYLSLPKRPLSSLSTICHWPLA